MLSKEEVLVWFKDLKGSCRVDLMCRLLRCCTSFELRHLCAVVESLVQDSYQILKSAEFQANHFIKREGPDQREHPCSDFKITNPNHKGELLSHACSASIRQQISGSQCTVSDPFRHRSGSCSRYRRLSDGRGGTLDAFYGCSSPKLQRATAQSTLG